MQLLDPRIDDIQFLVDGIEGLVDHIDTVSPSEFAEQNRYLPASVTAMPGYYDYDSFPFLREIVDCMDVRSPVQQVYVKKGAQIGFTTGVLENTVAYGIGVVKSAPMMFVTADDGIAKIRMDQNITPMLQQSGLEDLIQSNDEMAVGKKGKTNKKVEWNGGGYLLPQGANNAGKLRSFSIRFLLGDEGDGWKELVGKDGDPWSLCMARTKGYKQTRKILMGTTPLLKGSSRIDTLFDRGDQRYFMVPCLGCGESQRLRFSINKDGSKFGIVFRRDDDGMLIRDSVRYKCPHCGHLHREADKLEMLPRGHWEPTAKPIDDSVRSYHIGALYSPPTAYTWADCVQDWLNAWDVDGNRSKSDQILQEFYNNVLGESFEVRASKVTFEQVSSHRRGYSMGVVPNSFAVDHCRSIVNLMTCAVDVHDHSLNVAAIGWAAGKNPFIIDERVLEGDCTDLSSPAWAELRRMLAQRYDDGQGREYSIQSTLIDAGDGDHQPTVLAFCEEYASGVFPIVGRMPGANTGQIIDGFKPMKTKLGIPGYQINTHLYKSKWAKMLRREWSGQGLQPDGLFNAPINIGDKRLKELTVETYRPKVNKDTGKVIGHEWHRPSGSRNELWDLLVYNSACLDMIAWDLHVNQYELDDVDWAQFWDECAGGLYFTAA